MAGYLIDIIKHVIGQKNHMKAWRFQCEMEEKGKNDEIMGFFLNHFFYILGKLHNAFYLKKFHLMVTYSLIFILTSL
jgi:hypothetical protein